MRTVTKHCVGGDFVESHGREVMENIDPSDGQLIGHVTPPVAGRRKKAEPIMLSLSVQLHDTAAVAEE